MAATHTGRSSNRQEPGWPTTVKELFEKYVRS
jgi:hypothetical protein